MVSKKGQNTSEYIIILGLILFASIVVLFLFGGTIANYFSKNNSVSVYENSERTKNRINSQNFNSALTGNTHVQSVVLENNNQGENTAGSSGKIKLIALVKTPSIPVYNKVEDEQNDLTTYSGKLYSVTNQDEFSKQWTCNPKGYLDSTNFIYTNSGDIVVKNNSSKSDRTMLYDNLTATASNYDMALTFALTASGSGGMIFRATNGTNGINGYSFELSNIGGTQKLTFYKWVNGIKTSIASQSASNFGVIATSQNKISLNADGSTFTATINDKTFSVYDNTYKNGQVGMTFNNGTAATIKNIVIPSNTQ